MGAQPLTNIFFYPLEIIHSKKKATEQKKRVNYYPFGLTHKGYNDVKNLGAGSPLAQKFGFEGIELEESLGYNMNEMDWRHYDPAIGRFNVIDPMSEERDWLTPYNFVQNNPISRVDPTGLLDDFKLNKDGSLEKIANTEKADRIFATNEKGEVLKDKLVTLEKDGQIESARKDEVTTINAKEEEVKTTVTNIEFSSETKATEVFNFLADNSHVEWSQVDVKDFSFVGRNGEIGTSGDASTTVAGAFIKDYLYRKEGYKDFKSKHSHPRTKEQLDMIKLWGGKLNQKPSRQDINGAKIWNKARPKTNVKYKVYDPVNKTHYSYDHNTKIK